MIKKVLDSIMLAKFNRKAAAKRNMPDRVIKILKIRPGQNIADIGAGGGYYCFRFAAITGDNGRVCAVDINPGYLSYISKMALKKSLENISVQDVLHAPQNSIDLVFFRNSLHHIDNRLEYFKKIRTMLKDNGCVTVIDYKEGKHRHWLSKENLIKDMTIAGYILKDDYDFLPEQIFAVFSHE